MAKDKRKKILKAVESIIANRRFHEVTLDDVAKKAGVGKGTIYRYFDDKEDLFVQLAAEGFKELCELIQREGAVEAPFEERLLRVVSAIAEFFDRRHALMRISREQEERDSSLRRRVHCQRHENKQMLDAELISILETGQAQGIIRKDLDLQYLVVCLMSLLRGRMHYHHHHGEIPPLENLVSLFLHGAGKEGDQ